jgi:hypothetical protein
MNDQPQPTPTERLLSFAEALEDYYGAQFAMATADGDSPTTPLTEIKDLP